MKFLTIRVPACDECTQLKMMVMDTVEEYQKPSKNASTVATTDVGDSTQDPSSSPRIPEELLEAPPILHRLGSPSASLESNTMKGSADTNDF